MHVVVLGSGIVGTASAWYLHKAGHEVTVIDRQPEAARETSHANGGQVSAGHVEPWASPSTLPQLAKWAFQEDAPMLFRLRADLEQWRWSLQFLLECFPSRSRDNLRQLLQLGVYSRAALIQLREETGIAYHALSRGILNLYPTLADWDRGSRAADAVARLGYPRYRVTLEEALSIEPALSASRGHWVGATYTPQDESGDARQFTVALARLCESRGVQFRFNRTVQGISVGKGQVKGVMLQGSPVPLEADAVVVALGSFSASLLRPLGIRIPVYPVKGYSATIPITEPSAAPDVSVTDDACKMVFTRLGDQLRVAGTAEFAGFNLSLNPARCEALVRRARVLFPDAADYSQATFWAGLRPSTPSNRPLIGRTPIRNLYLNTGHGTLGWTLGCGSGQALADIVSGKKPEPDFSFSGI
jgi:D-amino-acid dehydrogenase